MSALLAACARLLDRAGVRHHIDHEQRVIRVVFLTRSYRNLRGERLAIVTLAAADDGRSCRAWIDRAFACGDDPAATCLAACRLARETPGIAVSADETSESISIGVVNIVGGARPSSAQLLAMLDLLVAAADDWHDHLVAKASRRVATPAQPVRRFLG